ncbi:hypothetical protein NQ314_014232 [Rhamnusium bicolor]|uniref:ZAD domain-containing protein n=1 Tax=Rhamnusium bicolor TaxID=1586634 RepID=A0AAV8X2V1_9CUCU|nr:hypothetical protein NQ314_014232 [Rhamnusium bicolor]
MCNDCKDNLQVFLNIKSACVYLKNRALPLTNVKDDCLNREEIDSTNNGKAAVESNDEITCWFCTKATGREGLVPLNESKENAFVVDMLNEHIPKLNLNNSEELLTCKTCLDSFQALLNFIIKCMDVEEKINKYIEIEGTDDQGQIELKNVQQFTFKLMLKDEIECFGVNEKGGGI